MSGDAARRAGLLLLAIAALGEMAVGALLVVFPAIGAVLIAVPLAGSGLLVTRMLGVAVLAIGLTWWLARHERNSHHVPGFLLYNVGVGALFALAAMSTGEPAMPWILAIAHLAVGATFGTLFAVAAPSGAAS